MTRPHFGVSISKPSSERSNPASAQTSARARWVLAVIVLTSFVLYRVPWGNVVLYPVFLLSTLAHEAGHGFAALLVGGSFDSLILNADGSGLAHTSGIASRLGAACMAMGGLVGPALVGFVLFVAGRWRRSARWTLVAFGALIVVLCLTVVGNVFGWIYCALVATICLYVGLRRSAWSQHAIVFVAAQLALSVYSRSDYLFTRVAATAQGTFPSDVELMARALLLPYWAWGTMAATFSLGVLVAGLASYLGVGFPLRRRTGTRRSLRGSSKERPSDNGRDAAIDAELARLRRAARR